MSITNHGRMNCDGCGKVIGWVNLLDMKESVSSSDLNTKDECHNCRARRLNREAKSEAQKSAGHDA